LSGSQRLPISLVIIAQNEAAHIADCLSSADFCAERLVLDGGSRDDTVALARAAGARVETRAFDGWISQKNAALQLARHDWVLSLDADERVSPELRTEILALFAAGPPTREGYELPRLSFHLGRWIRGGGWYPDRKLRLFRKSRGRWAGRDPHDKLHLDGPAGRLRGNLLHYAYRDLQHHLEKMERYTTVAAERLHAEGRGWALPQLLVRPPVAFVRDYLLLAGFRDGRAGLTLAVLSARYQWLRFLKLHRLRRAARSAHH
jgi:glycosyltransferase involved in cell wall biosynthesis